MASRIVEDIIQSLNSKIANLERSNQLQFQYGAFSPPDHSKVIEEQKALLEKLVNLKLELDRVGKILVQKRENLVNQIDKGVVESATILSIENEYNNLLRQVDTLISNHDI